MKYIMLFIGAYLAFATVTMSQVFAQSIREFRDGYVTRVETVWATRTVEHPVSSTRCQGVKSSFGDLLVGGLIGSALGNKLSDEHGAGTLGAFAGMLTATSKKSGQKCREETSYTSQSEDYPSHYIIYVRSGGQHLQFSSERPYKVRERVKMRVLTDYTLLH
ncbi:hypothetical protein N9X39_00710 [Alphaproteobacteria bacterium]|nr:hypothetical protein [Alphaproteobacteria bacterium]